MISELTCPHRVSNNLLMLVLLRLLVAQPAFLREAYRQLTGDCSAHSNVTERDVDRWIAQLLEDEDPDLIWDLCINSEGHPETYTTFLDFCRMYICQATKGSAARQVYDTSVIVSESPHRCTLWICTLPLPVISIFLALDLGFLCAVRTSTYHILKNPAEHITSILKVGKCNCTKKQWTRYITAQSCVYMNARL